MSHNCLQGHLVKQTIINIRFMYFLVISFLKLIGMVVLHHFTGCTLHISEFY